MKVIIFLLIYAELAMCVMYDLSITDCILTVISIPFAFSTLSYSSVKRSPMTSFLIIYLFCSFSVVSLTKFYPLNNNLGSKVVCDEDFIIMASYSIKVMFITFISVVIANHVFVRKVECWRYETFISPTYIRIVALLFLLALLSLISLFVGIGKMGSSNTQLPFHLSGVIQFIRVEVAPFLALLFYMSIKKESRVILNNRKKYIFLLLFFCWTLLETFVRISKSAIAYEFLPILIYEVIENAKAGTMKSLIVKITPFIFILLLCFFVVENVRNGEENVFKSDKELMATYNNHEAQNPFVRPYTRFFINGHQFLTSYYVVNQESLFDFSNMTKILALGGAARFKTFVIDRYPQGAIHSSGSTYIVDALMCGGYGLSFVFLIILVFMCVKVDQLINSSIPLIAALVLVLFVFKYIISGLSVSIIVDSMSINGILVTLFLLFIINRIKRVPKL